MTFSISPRQEAEYEQARGSDPRTSAWVTASAGSGKTKVLTDRVLRLLLAPDARPNAILCLTFTKAAAAEMSTRLARELGRWAVVPEAALAERLGKLLGHAPAREDLDRARGLLCRVLELPGGMRISTIHAFCQSLLRAFPLEAGLSPQFGVVESQEAAALLAEAQEEVLAGPLTPRAALDALAALVPPTAFAQLVAALTQDRERLSAALSGNGSLDGLCAAIADHLGIAPDADEHSLLGDAVRGHDAEVLAAARLLQASRNANDQARGDRVVAWLGLDAATRAARWAEWSAVFLTQQGTPRARLGTKDVGARQAECLDILGREAMRIAAVEGSRRACRLLAATRALLGLGKPVLDGYAARKAARGLLDFDDLITAARRVLKDPGSAWVLYKLDGGIDHVLLDEAQDSNPAQWGIAAALTGEFFAGSGTERGNRSSRAAGGDEPTTRTVFAVGDVKQSIYGFQGADAAGFERWKRHFARGGAAIGAPLQDVQLKVSFRSTAPVLALVDKVFEAGPARAGVVADGATLEHRADRLGQAGMVELWPMLEAAGREPPEPWKVPDAPARAAGPDAMLAEAIAARIKSWLDTGEMLPARGRRMRAGDILVLVRKRTGGLVPRLLRALKERGVPVGGADRLRLVEQIAVQDMLALCDVLLLPETDLQLAAVLKSPLLGFDEAQLFALAQGRTGSLWSRLAAERGGDTPEGRAADWLAALMARADHVSPHTLLAEVLGEHGARARLLARLGPDAADPLDELLNAALDHERRHPPSLQGFLHWLRRGGAEIKREQEAAGDAVRVMTVHNAKGLQAPVVILPDTVGAGRDDRRVRWHMEGETPLPLWAPRKDAHAPAFSELLDAEKRARAEEEHRLLYVALTRAEDRLLVCGWQRKRPQGKDWPEGCWYGLVAEGFARLGAAPADFAPAAFGAPEGCNFAERPLLRHGCPQEAEPQPDGRDEAQAAGSALPEWASRPAPAEGGQQPLSPSAIPAETETPAAAPHGNADPTGRRFRRGRLVHALLQHLPDRAPAEREDAARAFLARPGHGLAAEDQAEILAEVLALLDAPEVMAAFGPDSLAEAPIAGRLAGRLVAGQVDRLVVTPERVLVLDYKTNRPPPARPEEVSPLHLRQMSAYRAVLRQAFPGRAVDCALVWTYGARLMPLPGALLDDHAPADPPV